MADARVATSCLLRRECDIIKVTKAIATCWRRYRQHDHGLHPAHDCVQQTSVAAKRSETDLCERSTERHVALPRDLPPWANGSRPCSCRPSEVRNTGRTGNDRAHKRVAAQCGCHVEAWNAAITTDVKGYNLLHQTKDRRMQVCAWMSSCTCIGALSDVADDPIRVSTARVMSHHIAGCRRFSRLQFASHRCLTHTVILIRN